MPLRSRPVEIVGFLKDYETDIARRPIPRYHPLDGKPQAPVQSVVDFAFR